MRKIGVDFYYKLTEESLQSLISLIKSENRLDINKIIYNSGEINFEKGKDLIYSKIQKEGIILEGEKCDINLIINNTEYKILVISIRYDYDKYSTIELTEALINIPELTYGNVYNVEDHYWQSTDQINLLKGVGKFHDGLPLMKNDFGITVVDISENYGRSIYASGIRYMASWKQYYSPLIFKIFSRDKLLTFSKAESISILEDSIIEIQLFKDLFVEDYTENRLLQKEFFEYFDIVKITASIKKEYKRKGFPF